MNRKLFIFPFCCMSFLVLQAQEKSSFIYHSDLMTSFSSGEKTPLWLTANRYGVNSVSKNQFLLRAGLDFNYEFSQSWKIAAGIDLVGGCNQLSDFWIQQAYVDASWKALTLSIGSKERSNFPLQKDRALSSGWLAEGPNARPIPQVRFSVDNYLSLPFTNNWLALKGSVAFGKFVDDKWQKNFTNELFYTSNVLYHSKSIMFRIGQKERLPLEFEFGLYMASQFGGELWEKNNDGTSSQIMRMPRGFKAYWKAFLPQSGGSDSDQGEQNNIEGNMLGSWNFALNWYPGEWKIRAYLEHYFEDQSQMFWEYGAWKDGQLGIQVTLPKNKWITSFLWEGINTCSQTSSVLYNGFEDEWGDIQMSGYDNYYNHYIYQAWQHYGQGMGNPLLPGPLYNDAHVIPFRSNRIKAHHLGVSGNPTSEFSWRILASYVNHWGRYDAPLDKKRNQFSGLVEINYQPQTLKGWTLSVDLGLDNGNYIGDSFAGMLTLRKTGIINL